MRSVVEAPEVADAIDDAKLTWSRLDEAWDMLFWVLSKDPTVGQPLREAGHLRAFVFEGAWAHDMPTIDVVYELTDSQVIIRRVRFREPTGQGGNA
jgi:hypothetical protein